MKHAKAVGFGMLVSASGVFAQEQGSGEGAGLDNYRWINFAMLAVGLIYLLAKNLPSFFRSRTEAIQGDIAEAQKLKHEADRKAAEIERRVSGLAADIESFRTESRREMEREGDRIRKETAGHIAKLQEQAQGEIESAAKTAQREIRLFAANLALDMAADRVRARLDDNAEAALVENFIGDLKSQGSNN